MNEEPSAGGPAAPRRDPRDWTYVPVWTQAPRPAATTAPEARAGELWLLLADGDPEGAWGAALASRLAGRLAASGRRVVRALAGERFARHDEGTFAVVPGAAADAERLLAGLDRAPAHIVHLWGLAAADQAPPQAVLDRSFYSLLFLAQALGRRELALPLQLTVVTAAVHAVTGEERLAPLQAVSQGICGVIPRELPGVACRTLDLLPVADGPGSDLATDLAAEQILAELESPLDEPCVAFRHRHRFVRRWEPLPLPARAAGGRPLLRQRGVCLITGGLGGIGLALAEHLARQHAARLVLVGRSPLPERAAWPAWLAAHGEEERTSRRIRRLSALEELGAEVLVESADVTDPAAVAAAVEAADRRFGGVDAVVHAAGVLSTSAIQGKTRESAAAVLEPKVLGTLALAAALGSRPLDFFALASSISSALAPPGLADYAGASAFLDACAARMRRRGVPAVAIGFEAWRDTGMAVASPLPEALRARLAESVAHGLSSAEGIEVFDRAVGSGLAHVLVSTLPLDRRLAGDLDDGGPRGPLAPPLAASLSAPRPRIAAGLP